MSPTRRRVRLGWGVGRLLALVLFTVVMTALGIYQVNRHYQIVQLGYALDADLFEHRRLLEVNKRLELSLSAYKDPMLVRTLAEERLGMKSPGPLDELVIPRTEEGPPKPTRFGALDLDLDPGGAP